MPKTTNYLLISIIVLLGIASLAGCANNIQTNANQEKLPEISINNNANLNLNNDITEETMTSTAIKSEDGELDTAQINPNGKNYFKMKGDFNGDKKIDYLVYYEIQTVDSIIRNLATYLYSATDKQFNLVSGDSCDKKQCYFQNYGVEDFDNNKRHEVLAIKINLDKNTCNDLYVMEFKNNIPRKAPGLELINELCKADISLTGQKIKVGEAIFAPISEKDELKFVKQ